MSDAPRPRRLLGHLNQHEATRAQGSQLPPRFEPIRELGRGGMGAVVLAHDTHLGRQVAVKVLQVEDASLAQRKRLETEGKALAALRHPHVVPLHELIRYQGRLFLVMDFLDGESVADRLSAGRLAPREAARVARAVAEALECAHQRGVLHRDVKPANVVLTADGGVFLVDFGLAKQAGSSVDLTRTGQLLGTPDYFSPEQATDSKAVDARSDVYSLGASLFHMLTGRLVFPSRDLPDLFGQLLSQTPPSPRELAPEVPEDLAAICLRCLQKEPSKRYPDAQALADDLAAHLAGQLVQAGSRKGAWWGGLVALALALPLFVAAWVATAPRDPPQPSPAASRPAPSSPQERRAARPPKQVLAHENVLALAFLGGDSPRLVSAGAGSVRMWELGPEAHQLWDWEQVGVNWLAASPDGSLLACGNHATVHLLSTSDGQLVTQVKLSARTNAGLWLDDGRELLLGCEPPLGLQRVRSSDWTLLPTKVVDYAVHCLALDPKTGAVAWGGGVIERDFWRLEVCQEPPSPSSEAYGWQLSALPRCLVPARTPGAWVVGQRSGALDLLRKGQPAGPETVVAAPPESFPRAYRLVPAARAHVSGLAGVGFLDDGQLVSSTGRRLLGDLRMWDLRRPQPLVGLAIRDGLTVRALSVSASGKWLALGTEREGVIVLSAGTAREMASRNGVAFPD